jgi:hypothetical protein
MHELIYKWNEGTPLEKDCSRPSLYHFFSVFVVSKYGWVCKKFTDGIFVHLEHGQGEDASIEAAVMAISRCLRDPSGTNNCSEVL